MSLHILRASRGERSGRAAAASPRLLAAVLAFGAFATGCQPAAVEFPAAAQGRLEIKYPLDGTLFPPEIVAPTFVWSDATEGVAEWKVLLRYEGEDTVLRHATKEPSWRPTAEEWAEIKRRSTERDAEVAIVGVGAREAATSAATVRIRTSTDPVGDSIFYREVPLPFLTAVQDPSRIRWRFGSIDSEDSPPIVLENLPVCGNCHSFSSDGSVLGLDVDYGNDKGAYAVLPVSKDMVLDDEKIITWSDYRRDDGEATFGLLSQVSPDGRYVISTVKDRAVFVATPEITFSQLFFPIKGVLAVYDRKNGTFEALPGADDPAYVQSNPTWSPDGKYVVFARAKAYTKPSIANAKTVLLDEKDVPEFVERREPFKYDLYRVPFNDGKGGKAEPIEGASHNGMSNYFAKFSPDGKWIVFCKAKDFMLLMPDSELHIVPAEGGEARRLTANTPLMNSWHSFSSNGRWLVFSSKAYTPYTQLFLTHIDAEGNSTPPVVLERFTASDRAANIPEFVPVDPDTIAKIQERFLDAYSFLRAGMANERTGNYAGAVRLYRRGLEIEAANVELLNAIGFALFQQGHSREAVVELEKAIAADPKHAKSHNNMALASIELGELEIAEAHYRESLAIQPQPAIYNDLGVVLERLGMPEDAEAAYRSALKLDSRSSAAHTNLGASLARSGKYAEAEKHFRAALAADPKNAVAQKGLSQLPAAAGRVGQATFAPGP
ncbi:MAG: tetratricopeptide repeat protein [Lysobacterales bacterium]|nr:MAG: tetratricopeptide repeat protein [Xanthomonadales bacterium]